MTQPRTYFAVTVLLTLLAVAISGLAQTDSTEVQRHMARGSAAMQMAESPRDYLDAVQEFREAVKLAPDMADAWFNLGVAQESAEDYQGAIDSFNTYMEKRSDASDRAAVQSRIFALEYKLEKTDKEDKAEQEQKSLIASLTGDWDVRRWSDSHSRPTRLGKWEALNGPSTKWISRYYAKVKVDGDQIKISLTLRFNDKYFENRQIFTGTIKGNAIEGRMRINVFNTAAGTFCPPSGETVAFTGEIFPDEQQIVLVVPQTYYWGGRNGAECSFLDNSYTHSFLLGRPSRL